MTAVPAQVQVTERPGEMRAEWGNAPPPEWEARLRQVSPVVDRTSHLRFRWFARYECWFLYECTPEGLLSPARVGQLREHWSSLPKSLQHGRQRTVTAYQFWMFRTHRVEARPFWVLQGSQVITTGTPYSFTHREERLLEAEELATEPIPPGTLPGIPFSESVVEALVARDRLLKVGGDLDRLEKQNRPEHQRAQDEITERLHRQTFLKWHNEAMKPCSEFMAWFARRKEAERALQPAPSGLANTLSDWRDRYIETGDIGAGVAASRTIQVAVR